MRAQVFAVGIASLWLVGCTSATPTAPMESPAPKSDAGPPDDDIGGPDAGVTDVRFIVMGDVGTGSDRQYAVADAIEAKCKQDGCDFVVLLGDNIYQAGVSSTEDPQWQEKFELPYANIDLPFYAVLGNHDYGGKIGVEPLAYEAGGLGNEFDRGPMEVMYSDVSDKWNMPSTYYTLKWGNVGFIMLDTNSLLWDDTTHGDQRAWYQGALMDVSGSDWIIQAGHHPYRSNGAHGNAGNYEAMEIDGEDLGIDDIPISDDRIAGKHVKDFFDDVVCGTVDFSMSGHDHNRQWLDEPGALCGAELIVSGAGGKVKGFEPRGNATHFQDAATEGFLYVHVKGKTFTGQFIDKHGNVDFERTVSK